MRNLLIILLMSALGAAGWFLGEPLGIYAAFVLSMIASGVGLYAGRRLVEEFLP